MRAVTVRPEAAAGPGPARMDTARLALRFRRLGVKAHWQSLSFKFPGHHDSSFKFNLKFKLELSARLRVAGPCPAATLCNGFSKNKSIHVAVILVTLRMPKARASGGPGHRGTGPGLRVIQVANSTDHRDCHFREESLEKVTVLTSKRRVTLASL